MAALLMLSILSIKLLTVIIMLLKASSTNLETKLELFTTQRLWFQRIYTVRGSSCERNITRFNYAVVKISKQEITILHVPGKEVYFDLTIHMDFHGTLTLDQPLISTMTVQPRNVQPSSF